MPLFDNRTYQPREYAYSEYDFCHGVFTRDNRYVGNPPILMVRTDRWKLNYLSWHALNSLISKTTRMISQRHRRPRKHQHRARTHRHCETDV